MHLIESYATNCGLQIDKPFILEKYFPIGLTKYITFQCSSEQPKMYDYWSDVIDILRPTLMKEDISIVQMGKKTDKPQNGAYPIHGQTTLSHEAYIMKDSLLHFGVDGHLNQLAGFYNKKIVSLFSNSIINNFKPYFGDSSNHVLIKSSNDNEKPSCAPVENPKSINRIKPELIARHILRLLGFDARIKYKSVSAGSSYFSKIIESVPNQVVEIKGLGVNNIIVRMDFLFNEENLAKQLQICPCSIVTDRPINKRILIDFKKNIKEIVYFVDENHDPEFVDDLQKNALPYVLLSKEAEADLEKYKIHYMDYGIIHSKKPPANNEFKGRKLFYKSSKITLSNGKIYPSKYAYDNDLPITSQIDISEAPDNEGFFEEREYFSLLEKTLD